MRIVDIRERSVPISRYAGPAEPDAALTTSIVAVVTDAWRNGAPLVGYGFASVGRFAQGGLIRERFAPRLLSADPRSLLDDGGTIDPVRAWSAMMVEEKPGGHGDRCVAVGALDMALWDLAAKASGLPLHRLLAARYGVADAPDRVPVYAGGGYPFPADDKARLADEAAMFRDLGFPAMKMKIGAAPLATDLARLDTVLGAFGDGARVAVDAMNRYGPKAALDVARALAPYGLKWFEDICDPLDYETHRAVAEAYAPPVSAGEALFSRADACNLRRYGGLRPGHDVLTFDPAHCYGIVEFARLVADFEAAGWSRLDFQPHGGHLYGLHVAAGLGLGGCECNPHNFQPFGGFADGQVIADGTVAPPDAPGLGFETRAGLIALFRELPAD